jgi:uncharacterized protein (TIGR02145 family)
MVNLTGFIDLVETKPANSILNTGLHITSDKEITAFYEVQSPHNAETWPLLGRNGLGYEFIIPSQQHFPNYQYCNPPAVNSFEIVATEDSTQVKILPRVPLVGHLTLDTIRISLNRGQTWNGSAISGDSTSHLAGSFVFSNKPVAVTIADDAVYIPPTNDNNSQDIAGAQLIPRQLCGTEFAFGAYFSPFQREDVYVYAFEDATSIVYTDSLRIISRTINRGDSIDLRMIYSSGWLVEKYNHIQSNKPILVYHFFSSDAVMPPPFNKHSPQAASVIIPPVSCAGSRRVLYTITPPIGLPSFTTEIIVKKIYMSGFQFSPPVPGWDTTGYDIIPGTLGTLVRATTGSYTNFPLGLTCTVTNTKGRFQFTLFSMSSATDTSDYFKAGCFSDFSALYLGPDRSMCPGDSILLDAGYGHDTYLWNNGDTTQTIWAKTAGTFWVHTTEEGACNLSDTINISYYSNTPVNLGPDRQICSGDSILLNAGGGRTWYDWSTGASTQTIWVKNPGTYWVKVPDIHCTVYDTVIVTTTPVPAVMNSPLSETICSMQSTNVVLIPSVSGASFHWTATLASGNITGFSADSGTVINQILTNSLSSPGIVTYHITPKVGSCTGATVDYQVTVNPGVPVTISISESQNNVCAGTLVNFTANPGNQGTAPVYQWKVNNINQPGNSTTFNYAPLNNDVITCVLTSSNTICTSNNPATSNTITMTVYPLRPVSVTVMPSQNPVCTGTSVLFTANPTHGGTSPIYQWKVNGSIQGGNSQTYSYMPLNGDIITCSILSNDTCPTNNPAQSPPVSMVVNPFQPVSVSITATPNPFCQDSSVTFHALPVNGGMPTYQWRVNGLNVGSGLSTYTYTPTGGDVVDCILHSSLSCVNGNPSTSNSITMVVNSGSPAGVTITASPNPFCPGTTVICSASPVNGGSAPSYFWKVNGLNVGINSNTYSFIPGNGDSIRCVMTSNLGCVTGSPASSQKIILSYAPLPIVTFTSCFDTLTTLNSTPIKLKGGIPLGGIYSGPGVNSGTGIFTPSIAGTGTKTITYTYTNANSCSANKILHIIVLSNPNFTCGNIFTDIRDGKTYPTVQIGSQCWMAANLNFGTILPSIQDQRDNCISEKYCYNDNPTNCTSLGGLYQWDELMLYDNTPADQGFCPPGWHIPTENEWNTLFSNYISSAFAGSPLKYSGYSGFTALLSGDNYLHKSWNFNGFATFFWSSTQHSPTQAWAHGMNDPDPSISAYPALKTDAFSVRCLHN